MHRFDLGAGSRKKGQDNKIVTKVLYFAYLWGALTGPIRPKSCMVGDVHDIITCVKFQIHQLQFYRVSNFLILLLIIAWGLQQCSANALPVKNTDMNVVSKTHTSYMSCRIHLMHTHIIPEIEGLQTFRFINR